LIEKNMVSPSVLAMLLTTKYADGLPLHRFETVLSRHGIEIARQTLERWVIQCSEHFESRTYRCACWTVIAAM
jgi:transposase